MTTVARFLMALDKAILAVFVIELTIRLLVHRFGFFQRRLECGLILLSWGSH